MKKLFCSKKNIIIMFLSCIVLFVVSVLILQTRFVLYKQSIPSAVDYNLMAYNYKANCVPDEEAAIGIAKVVYKVRTGIDFPADAFEVQYIHNYDAWNVHLKGSVDDMWLGYKGIYIDKDYATISRDYISKSEIQNYQEVEGCQGDASLDNPLDKNGGADTKEDENVRIENDEFKVK